MAITPAEKQAIKNAITETALAIDDRVNATTVAQKQAAFTRYVNGQVTMLTLLMNLVKSGSQGDY